MTGRILIVDDLATNRIVLKVRLSEARYDTILAATGTEGLRLARSEQPDLILLDVALPDIDGIEMCRQLRADPTTRDIPVIAITAGRDRAVRVDTLAAGADDVLWKPVDDGLLQARLRSLLRGREPRSQPAKGLADPAATFRLPPRAAIVCHDLERALALGSGLRPHFQGVLSVDCPDTALGGFEGMHQPDAILVLTAAPGIADGLRLVSELRARPGTRDAALLVAAPPADRAEAMLALDIGACDLIDADAAPEEIALRLRKCAERKQQEDGRRESVAENLRLAYLDPLTGLHNRRFALQQLERIAGEASVSGLPFTVMLIDIDRFKTVNDTFGHRVGDHVLATVAARLRNALGPDDLLARIGGEEFLAVIPACEPARAHDMAEAMRRHVGRRPVLSADGGKPVAVTVSVGIAIGGGTEDTDTARLLDQADGALMSCKGAGRNRVRLHRQVA